MWNQRKAPALKVLKSGGTFALAALPGLCWMVWNWVITLGNPVYPMAWSIFGGRGWDESWSRAMTLYYDLYGVGKDPLDCLLLPWRLAFSGQFYSVQFDGVIGLVLNRGYCFGPPLHSSPVDRKDSSRDGICGSCLGCLFCLWNLTCQVLASHPSVDLHGLCARGGALHALGKEEKSNQSRARSDGGHFLGVEYVVSRKTIFNRGLLPAGLWPGEGESVFGSPGSWISRDRLHQLPPR